MASLNASPGGHRVLDGHADVTARLTVAAFALMRAVVFELGHSRDGGDLLVEQALGGVEIEVVEQVVVQGLDIRRQGTATGHGRLAVVEGDVQVI